MARIANLHDVGFALAEHLRRNISPSLDNIVAGPPIENAASAAEGIRVTLLWVTPQPTHRNDPWVVDDAGQSNPPPVTLSGFYLVTAYGVTDSGEPLQAYNRMGEVIQIFETAPLELPLPDDPATPDSDPVPGEGKLTVTLVPTAADLMEKVFTPLQMKHRPWVLYEVGPIQLQRMLAPRPAPEIVHPGGPRLQGPAPISAPSIEQITPERVRAGGLIRVDTQLAASATEMRIGDRVFTFADTPVGPDQIGRPNPDGQVFVRYPAMADIGDFDIVIRSAEAASGAATVTVQTSTTAGVDAPMAPVSISAGLSIAGQGLATTQSLSIWPARGIQDPSEVITLVPTSASDTTVSVDAATLSAQGARTGQMRVSLRIAEQRFTPFVTLELIG